MDRGAVAEALAQIPSQPLTTIRILQLAQDEARSAMEVGRLIEIDPALSTRVLRLANSPYYGLSTQVASAGRAAIMLGFSTVRALAVSSAASLLMEGSGGDGGRQWAHAVTAAVAAGHVAHRAGFPTDDAFTAGLLHDLGRAVLHLIDERGCHAEAGAAALEHWRFPPALVDAVASHHDVADRRADSLTLVVQAGAGLAGLIDPDPDDAEVDPTPALTLLGLDPSALDDWTEEIIVRVGELAAFVEAGA